MSTEIILPNEQVQDLAPADSPTLWGTSDPTVVIERATAVSKALMGVVRSQNLSVRLRMGGKESEYLLIEAWTMLGSMVGVFPRVEWTRAIKEDGKSIGWEARVEAVTRSGAVVGAAESMCTRDESTTKRDGSVVHRWAHADEHALRSMAQTRASSKALATCLRFVAVLAGFAGTPAEEMPRDGQETAARGQSTARWTVHPTTGKGSVCRVCEAAGFTSTTGLTPTFRLSKKGNWQCNGRTTDVVKDGERGWLNHPMPLAESEPVIDDPTPVPFG